MLYAPRCARKLCAIGLILVAWPGCGRVGFDLLASNEAPFDPDAAGGSNGGSAPTTGGAGAGGSRSGGAPASTGGTSGTGGSELDASRAGNGSGAIASTGGTGSAGASPRDAAVDSHVDGSSSLVVCNPGAQGNALKVWSFDAGVEGWVFSPNSGTATLSFTGAMGNPTAGALSLDATSGDGLLGWVMFYQATRDLRGQRASAWVYLEAGTSVGLKLFAQSSTFAWADGGFVTVMPGRWTCLSLDLDSPVYTDAGFDAGDITRFGIEVGGSAPARLIVDQLVY